MSSAATVVVSAFGGAVLTWLATYVARLREEYALRIAALEVMRDELTFACLKITAALESDDLWPAALALAPAVWNDYRDVLVTRLSRKTWSEIQNLVTRLGVADTWAQELRSKEQPDQSGRSGPSALSHADFRDELTKLQEGLDAPIKVLATARTGTARSTTVKQLLLAGGVACAIALGVILATAGPALTGSSLANSLRAQLPGSQKVICNASTTIEGAYTCDAIFPPCAAQLTAASEPTACSPTTEQVYQVATQGSCYTASLAKLLRDGQPASSTSNKFIDALVRWGCKKG